MNRHLDVAGCIFHFPIPIDFVSEMIIRHAGSKRWPNHLQLTNWNNFERHRPVKSRRSGMAD